jgi:hypothetical protein
MQIGEFCAGGERKQSVDDCGRDPSVDTPQQIATVVLAVKIDQGKIPAL